ncbi:tRNA (m7G46) methyltransferase, SAM-dependent [Candidatus Methylobacter favarea]|uniref:tRNA (guanine-N(7)-)-methyltransferase n=1 Tax=Candidatus Methylobacter favarea TaxID=2707345 RepID=A0A8S0XSY5_9GAMM|nr:tRNA (guanosine(46)-N7)-methyltransferase TrmB [Candidatus Methylobacter favarea]CAA9891192.1 tRNA (m7G46) methyltransferase, SAM-dependent [Candidatus Methylobacter favarea]
MSFPEKIFLPRIRSFIRRQGRITQGQQLALANYWEKYGLDPTADYDFARVFGRHAPLYVEIGFGNGDNLARMAAANPDKNYIGIEVHRPGVGHLLLQLEQHSLDNVRIYCHDAIEIFEQKITDNSVAGVYLFFPDPWPKKKHHKRRLVRPDFVELVVRKLTSGGYFHAATDWQNYAENMLAVLTAETGMSNISNTDDYCERPGYRPLTKFEQRGLRLGHGVWDLIFKKE